MNLTFGWLDLQLYKISVFGSSTGRLLSTSQRYLYNEDDDVLIDNSTGVICSNDGDNFICNGKSVDPGWRIFVGSENYKRLFSNQRIRGCLGSDYCIVFSNRETCDYCRDSVGSAGMREIGFRTSVPCPNVLGDHCERPYGRRLRAFSQAN